MRRKILDQMIYWKKTSAGRTALLIDGARRVGKSYIAEEFAKKFYKSYILIDFNKAGKDVRDLFENNLQDLDSFFMYLSALYGVTLYEKESLIILDEVQLFPRARAAVKFLVADGRYQYVETGSLMSIRENVSDIVIPSEERHLKMYPMDFEEFLWAKGISEAVLDEVKRCFNEHMPVSETIHTAMLRYFREYMCVGGMPYVVDRFLSTNDMNVVLEEQRDILEEFKDDFGKHLDENEKEETDFTLLGRINRVFDSIPAQLAKENKKFTYAALEKKGRSENYQAAIQWLYDAGIINICYNLSNLSLPLEGNKVDNIFKIYMQDTGLFVAMLEEGSAGRILSGELGMYKGAIYENIVADAFSKSGRSLFYFHKESGLEIDFITPLDAEVTLVEVKATNGNAKSANTVLKNKDQYGVNRCIKLSANNVGQVGEKLTLPYYMIFLLN